MIKKTLIATGAVVLLSVVFLGRDAVSYVFTSACRVKESVRGQVPIEFEIDRARRMVKNLVPEIRKNMHVIAKEEVEVERLEREINNAASRLAADRADIMRLKGDLAQGRPEYRYVNRTYTADEVKEDLARRFERFKTTDATVASLRDIHQARLKSLDAARAKLEGMLAAKRQLEVEVENLEARLKMVEVAQTTSHHQFDESRLSRVKGLVTDIRSRLKVAEKLVNADVHYADEIPLKESAPDNLLEQVAEYFDGQPQRVASASETQ